MSEIMIVKAKTESLAGGRLNCMALGDVSKTLAGSKEDAVIDHTFGELTNFILAHWQLCRRAGGWELDRV
ncbi:hypothetical protein ACX93W_06730 [Paenibacillus sp. CAU 1782]